MNLFAQKKNLALGFTICFIALTSQAFAQTPVGGNNVIVDYSVIAPYGAGAPAYYPYGAVPSPYPAYPTYPAYAPNPYVPYGGYNPYAYPARQAYPAPGGIAGGGAIQYYPAPQPYPAYPYQPYPAAPYGVPPYGYGGYGVAPVNPYAYVPAYPGGAVSSTGLKQPRQVFVPAPRPFDPNEAPAAAPKRKKRAAQSAESTEIASADEVSNIPADTPTPPPPGEATETPDSVSPLLGPSPQAGTAAPAESNASSEANATDATNPPAGQENAAGEATPEQQAAAETSKQPETPAQPAAEVRIVYAPESDELPKESEAQLSALAEKMKSDEEMRIQVLAYASGTPEAESKARRLSLSRGLNVRAFLINAGIRSTRIEIRALGLKLPDAGPADRVDIVPAAN